MLRNGEEKLFIFIQNPNKKSNFPVKSYKSIYYGKNQSERGYRVGKTIS